MTWTPTAGEVGPQTVVLAVSDGSGATTQQPFLLQVLPQPGDNPPVIDDTTTAFTTQLGSSFSHQVHAVDADGDPLTYSFVVPAGGGSSAPEGMTIDPTTGLVQWTPQAAGQVSFTVHVADGRGGVATQTYSVTVVDTTPGAITGIVFDDPSGSGVFSAGDSALAGWTVFIDLHHDQTLEADDPSTVTNAAGAYSFTNLAPGSYDVELFSRTGGSARIPRPARA